MRQGQIVVGPPGSGKSTYCAGLCQLLTGLGRSFSVVNLDPANIEAQYAAEVDVRDLITAEDAGESCSLGPNGALMFCVQFLAANQQWLIDALNSAPGDLFLFDCPGQVELYTVSNDLKGIFKAIERECQMKLVVVNLVDCNLCAQPSTYISACMVSLAMMTHLELPHINVLSKIDTLGQFYESLPLSLSCYTDLKGLEQLEVRGNPKLQKLSKRLVEVLDDFSLVSFLPLAIQDKDTVLAVLRQVDRSLGCSFAYSESFDEGLETERVQSLEEKYAKLD
jgi:GTPase SAR1 family protein